MPRQAHFEEAATEAIRIRVTPSQKREIQAVARENKTDVAGMIRSAVNEFVSDYRDGELVFRGPNAVEHPHNQQ